MFVCVGGHGVGSGKIRRRRKRRKRPTRHCRTVSSQRNGGQDRGVGQGEEKAASLTEDRDEVNQGQDGESQEREREEGAEGKSARSSTHSQDMLSYVNSNSEQNIWDLLLTDKWANNSSNARTDHDPLLLTEAAIEEEGTYSPPAQSGATVNSLMQSDEGALISSS